VIISDYMHLSFNGTLEGIWEPQDPAGEDVVEVYEGDEEASSIYLEPSMPRISLGPTVELCFLAIYPNVSKYFEEHDYPYLQFHVYRPVITGKTVVVTHEELTARRLVHDAHVTKECVITTPTKMVHDRVVKVMNTNKSKDLYYRPFNDTQYPRKYLGPKSIEVVD